MHVSASACTRHPIPPRDCFGPRCPRSCSAQGGVVKTCVGSHRGAVTVPYLPLSDISLHSLPISAHVWFLLAQRRDSSLTPFSLSPSITLPVPCSCFSCVDHSCLRALPWQLVAGSSKIWWWWIDKCDGTCQPLLHVYVCFLTLFSTLSFRLPLYIPFRHVMSCSDA